MPVDDDRNLTALFVPVEGEIRQVKISDRAQIDGLVGGWAEMARYDKSATCWINGEGRSQGLPINPRATDYIKTASEAAQEGRMIEIDPAYGLYGAVVMTGMDPQTGALAPLPERIVEHFAGKQIEPTVEPEIVVDPHQQYVVGYTVVQDGESHTEHLSDPQTHTGALFVLRDEMRKLIEADDGFAFDAETADIQLAAVDPGEDFEVHVEDRTYFMHPDQGNTIHISHGYRQGF